MTFKEKAASIWLQDWHGEADQFHKRRYRPGYNDGEFYVRYGFDSPVDYGYRCIRYARGLGKKRAFARIALDQMNMTARHDRENQSGKPGSASDIRDLSRYAGNERHELSGIKNVSVPNVWNCRFANEIFFALPCFEQLDETLESFHRFRTCTCFAREIFLRYRMFHVKRSPLSSRQLFRPAFDI